VNFNIKLSFVCNRSLIRRRNEKLFSNKSINEVWIVCHIWQIRQCNESQHCKSAMNCWKTDVHCMWNIIRHSFYDRMFKLEFYWCQNKVYQSCKVSHVILEENNELWFEIWVKIEDSYKMKWHSCIQLCEQQLCWECYRLKIHYELCVHVEWWCYNMNV